MISAGHTYGQHVVGLTVSQGSLGPTAEAVKKIEDLTWKLEVSAVRTGPTGYLKMALQPSLKCRFGRFGVKAPNYWTFVRRRASLHSGTTCGVALREDRFSQGSLSPCTH